MKTTKDAALDRWGAAGSPGATTGMVRLLLQSEGLAVAAGSAIAFQAIGGSWLLFASLVLLPDAFMVGYIVNRRIGAALYNAGHTYVAPAVLAATGYLLDQQEPVQLALIWSAHIGFDRLMGYGLKYPGNFKATHLMSGGR
jgi:Domain of unknown function (DUF4260)